MDIRKATTEEEFKTVAQVAREVWTEHYEPIIGLAQVEYMLDKFQSPEAIATGVAFNRYHYYLAWENGAPVGYLALQDEAEQLFLSKIYVKKEARGKGVAHAFVDLAVDYAKKKGYPSIYLTVNKHNTGSIAAYEKMGFVKTRSQVSDIGNGFVMDDFVMTLTL